MRGSTISMPSYRFTGDAQSDLIKIRGYTLKEWGNEQSKKYLSNLRQTIRLLSETPTIGKQRPDISSDVFSFPHVSHVIYYMLRNEQLVVFGVLHKSMVPNIHLEDRETI